MTSRTPREALYALSSSTGGLTLSLLLSLVLVISCQRTARAVIITEIMYHPSAAQEAGGRETGLEWIEIFNDEPTVVNLSGYWFSQGVAFVFPEDTYLEGRSYLVVAADEENVRQEYGLPRTATIGNFDGRLDNNGETISLNIFGGGPEVTVDFSDRGQWPKEADGTGHTLILIDPYEDPNDNDNWTYSTRIGGSPGFPNFEEPTIVETEVFSESEIWRYRKNTTAYPNGWNTIDFDDSAWLTGETGIGYGDGDDVTELDDMRGNYRSFAARYSFELTQEDLDAFDDVSFLVRYDDGIVCYLNGIEVFRSRMGDPGEAFNNATGGSSHEASNFEPFEINANRFRVGTNVFAVGIHNATLNSSDCSFQPRLISSTIRMPEGSEPVPVVINECLLRTDGDGWFELHNTSGSEVDVSGFYLSDDNNALDKFTIPDGTVIPGGGFVTFTASETGFDFSGLELAVFFTRPNLGQVLDAAHFNNNPKRIPSLEGMSDARFPDGGDRFSVSTTPTAGAANAVALHDEIVINEIMYHPPLEYPYLKYIELYNRSDSAVDLSGFRLNRGVTFGIPDGTTLGAGDYLVIAARPDAIENAHEITGVLGPWEGDLAFSDENVRLVDSLGNIVDQVHYYDGGRWPKWADGGGSSLELIDPSQDNSVASAWEASDETQKAPWEEIEYSLNYAAQSESEFQIRLLEAGEALVDDVTVTRGGTQYVRNPTFASNTSSWIIDGNHVRSHRTSEDGFDGNTCLRVVSTGSGDTRVNRIETETSPRMSSGTYAVHVAARWLRGGNLIFFSCYAQHPNCQKEFWLTIPRNLGTPGARNSTWQENLGPVISDVTHSPAVPAQSTSVTVVATVTDSDGVASVLAEYETSGNANGSVELFDDGASGDGAAGDGVYGGRLPGFGNATRVTYSVNAQDSLGARRVAPREFPDRNFVYLHSSMATSNAFTFRVIHDDANWSELNSRRLHSNELLDATFVFNEEKVFYNVGTRYRGSPWNRPGNPKMYRVSFEKDNPYRRKRKINLSRYGSGQNERAAGYAVWRNSTTSTTVPFNRATWGRVITRGGTFTMEAQDPWGTGLLKLWYPEDSDGLLMKITGRQIFDDNGNHRSNLLQWASYTFRGTAKTSYRWNFNLRTRELEDDFNPLITLLRAMSGSSTSLDNSLNDIMDVEQFLRLYAARVAHDDWDTISIGNGQNMYIYYAMNEGRWKLLPWDMDHTWGNAGARTRPDSDSRMRAILARPKWSRVYSGIVNEMLNGRNGQPGYWTIGEFVTKFLDRNSAVVGASPDRVGNSSRMRSFMNARRGSMSNVIPARVNFSITTNSGQDHTVNETSVRLDGRGWVDIDTILINGEPANNSWVSTTSWRINSYDLFAGENVLEFVAFDVEGNIVGSDSITITGTVGWANPEITSVDPATASPNEFVTIEGIEFHDGIEVEFNGVPALSVEFSEEVDSTRIIAQVPMTRPDEEAEVIVRNVDDRESEAVAFTITPPPPEFIRGDANMDLEIDISDGVFIIRHLFAGVATLCRDALDTDADNALSITDAVRVLAFVYQNGEAPAAPFPDHGTDPDEDAGLDCAEGLDLFAN